MENAKKETFGERVFRQRAKLGLSQSQLAKKIGASHGSIQNYEANSLPKGKYAIKLAEVFDCSIDWLLTGKNPAPIYKGRDLKNEGVEPDSDPPSQNDNLIVIEHQGIIKSFKDPLRAKEINEDLVEIEDLSEELLDSIAAHIKSSLNAARVMKRTKKNTPKNSDGMAVNGD